MATESYMNMIDLTQLKNSATDITDPWEGAVIQNPSNNNEIFVIGGYQRLHILIYKKNQHTLIQSKMDLASLQQNGQQINPNGIHKVQAISSNINNNHIVVTISYNSQLYYSIFDCQSYQWINFSKDTNVIDQFMIAKGVNINNDNHEMTFKFGAQMIAVENYLIFTGTGKDCNNIDILDISDESSPIIIHRSKMNQTYGWHGCVRLPNNINTYGNNGINVNTTSMRLLLFGGSFPFSSSVFELKITFSILKTLASGQKYPVVISKSNKNKIDGGKLIKDSYVDSYGKNVEIAIEYKHTPWKCTRNDDDTLFDTIWYKFSYEWQNEWSDLIVGLNKKNTLSFSKFSAHETQQNFDDEKHQEKNSGDHKNTTQNVNHRYLAIFGGCYWDGKNPRVYPNDIAIYDTYNSEWYLSKYKLQSLINKKTCFNSLMDENGLLYVLGSDGIYRFDIEMELAAFFRQKFRSKDNSLCQTILASVWKIAQNNADKVAPATIARWISVGDFMEKIHLLLDCDWWGLSDVRLLKILAGIWHNKGEFKSDELALMHDACRYNNVQLLAYLIKNNICNTSNYNIKNKATGIRMCLDVALMNDSDECLEILLKEFGDQLEYVSSTQSLQSVAPTLEINTLASRKLSVLRMYHENGMNWNVRDKKGLYIIHHVLKYGNHEALEYVIENDICSIDEECIEIICDNFGENHAKCIEMLRNMSVQYTIEYENSALQCTILRDSDKALEAWLTLMLNRQSISDIQSYRDNKLVTFEFILNLFKLCIKRSAKKCTELLKYWLQKMIEYYGKSSNINHNYDSQMNGNDETCNLATCMLCLESITTRYTEMKHEYDYCDCCDYLVCKNCKSLDNYAVKRVQCFFLLFFCFFACAL